VKIENWLLQNKRHFPHGEKEVQVILHQLEKERNVIETTSCGRVLDAVAAVLGVCYERTYEGEPAMKLEAVATKGKDVLRLEPRKKGNTLDTAQMLSEIFENREGHPKTDLAFSAHTYIAKGLAALAIEKALENNVKNVGFSGGVACNEILTSTIRKIVEAHNLRFLVHTAIPPGDGGTSLGQAVAASFSQF